MVHGLNILSWKESNGDPFVHQPKSRVLNIIEPRCELASNH
jgi:hypothetical protein